MNRVLVAGVKKVGVWDWEVLASFVVQKKEGFKLSSRLSEKMF